MEPSSRKLRYGASKGGTPGIVTNFLGVRLGRQNESVRLINGPDLETDQASESNGRAYMSLFVDSFHCMFTTAIGFSTDLTTGTECSQAPRTAPKFAR